MSRHDDLFAEEQVERAKGNLARLADLAKRMNDLPADKEESRELVVSGVIRESRSLARTMACGNLTETQAAIAIMLGRGLLYQEAANALDIDEMDIHEWNTTVPDFRGWVKYFRKIMQEEQWGYAVRELQALADRSDDDRTLMRLIETRLKIASKPDEEERFERELALKRRAQEMRETETAQRIKRSFDLPPRAVMLDVVDGDVEDAEDEEAAGAEDNDE
jgi:hypothetical protein